MNRRLNLFALVTFALILLGCGSSSSSTNTPAPTDTANSTGTLSTGNGVVCPTGVPSWACDGSQVPLFFGNANEKTLDYPDLANIASTGGVAALIVAPLVSDARVSLVLSTSRSSATTTAVRVSFEDDLGWYAEQVPSFPGDANWSGSTLTTINSDANITYEVTATLDANGNLSGQIYYRVRQTGDTQCETITCNGTAAQCALYPPPDTTVPCQNYMATTNSAVQYLGYFQNASFATWSSGN